MNTQHAALNRTREPMRQVNPSAVGAVTYSHLLPQELIEKLRRRAVSHLLADRDNCQPDRRSTLSASIPRAAKAPAQMNFVRCTSSIFE